VALLARPDLPATVIGRFPKACYLRLSLADGQLEHHRPTSSRGALAALAKRNAR